MEAALRGPFGYVTLGQGDMNIGRAPDNQLVLNDQTVSSHHLLIRLYGDSYLLMDLNSTSGTYVNGNRVTQHTLRANDVIHIGNTDIRYEEVGIAPTVYVGGNQGAEPAYIPTERVSSPFDAGSNIPPAPPGAQGYYQEVTPSPYDQPLPGYAAPYPGYAPGAPAPASVQPQKKSRRTLWIVLGIVGAIMLFACAGCGILAYIGRSTPTRTLTTFCTDMQNANYQDAYQQLSTRVQNNTSQSNFTRVFSEAIDLGGGLTSCTVSNVTESGSSGSGVITMQLKSAAQPSVFNTVLVNEGGTWKIDQLNAASS